VEGGERPVEGGPGEAGTCRFTFARAAHLRSPRNDGSCPGEISKTFRLAGLATEVFAEESIEADLLDLSLLTSEYGRKIHERWVAAHAVLIVTPVHWYQSTSALKLMIDRLVCADGGNPDPTSTHGKDAKKAKQVELAGWDYPKHLAGRAYGVVVHGDVAGIDGAREALTGWLEWMGLIDAGSMASLDRFIGYYQPYATSHEDLDRDHAVQEEVRELRAGHLSQPDRGLENPRPK
jgi:multimeric flavodoxin WrbA